jgi:FAD/FMN-containing dehydrogenase
MLPLPPIRGIYRTDPRARAAYAEGAGIYRIVPQAVALPADLPDLQTLVRWAAEHRVPLTPRGAGSGMGGGNVGAGVLVDLTRMAGRRLELDHASNRAFTSAQVTLAELNSATARLGLRLPPDPSSGRWATLGGMVATNAAGARSVRYGSVRRWIEALTMVTADGEAAVLRRGSPGTASDTVALTRFERNAAPSVRAAGALVQERFPRSRKNSSGYALDSYLATSDPIDLIIGSEGTLGIITDIEWRLDRLPSHRAGLRIALPSLEHLGDVVSALRQWNPSAIELLDRSFLDLLPPETLAKTGLAPGTAAVLLVELEADDADTMDAALRGTAAAAQRWAESVETASLPEEAERLWAIRHAASPILAGLPPGRRSLQVIEDGCVPIGRLGEYIEAVREAARERQVTVVMFGHAGDGHLHVNLLPEIGRPGWEDDVAALLKQVTATVARLRGTPSGEHGDGRLRAGLLVDIYGTEIMKLFRLVKDAFDPLGILNPGIILPSGDSPISHLKVGAEAATLPPDIGSALREIEISGGYARCRLELAGEVGS